MAAARDNPREGHSTHRRVKRTRRGATKSKKGKGTCFSQVPFLVGEAGFEPAKSWTTDLQSAPFGRSGIPPYSFADLMSIA